MKEDVNSNTLSEKVIMKAMKDKAFRKELIANPNAVIAKELGMAVPEGVSIKVVEDTQTELHLVLPAMNGGGGAISDSDLDKVSGGAICTFVSGGNISGGGDGKQPPVTCLNCTTSRIVF